MAIVSGVVWQYDGVHDVTPGSAQTLLPSELSLGKFSALVFKVFWNRFGCHRYSVSELFLRRCPLLVSPIVHENADSPKQRILSQEALIMTEHSKHTEAHIDSIVRQEEEALKKRSYSERLADRIGTLAGSIVFVSHA